MLVTRPTGNCCWPLPWQVLKVPDNQKENKQQQKQNQQKINHNSEVALEIKGYHAVEQYLCPLRQIHPLRVSRFTPSNQLFVYPRFIPAERRNLKRICWFVIPNSGMR